MKKLDEKSQTIVVANYKLDWFTLFNSTSCDDSIFTNKMYMQISDNTMTLFLLKMGGAGSREMTVLAKEIWEFGLSQKITITAKNLPGKLNVRADWASRNFQDFSEWLLSPRCFKW